ncbi:chemotaxis-specific protein-glutamate methyltransferase CheB [Chelatococcus daeguensis]|uniref:chemotaxis-specific protein-glutamate methyltransferase CheB n=1 Tax=Chelatococcus daeguensis TaxID=444444 RepID=UPI0007AB89EA|nr:chemotaxis-specific protein-glutamate methyltransferase CheB [Chelatococcus daeguensis]KZE36292.1 chemotaxis response regulator protein-glutamate methylesterase [Chelatococcus daeguensis]MBM3084229.1 chemotaxis-specific protein-glutamate methyltransferase CheB [Chelatococcus daeguensis]
MVVDDSAVARALALRWLSEEPGIDVVAEAETGRVALALVARADPDVIVLDLDMPDMDGLTALPELLAARPGVAVLVVSTLTRRNAEISLHCLARGAADYVPKPSSRGDAEALVAFRNELVEKIRAIVGRGANPDAAAGPPRLAASRSVATRPACLVVGASTGGPRAMMRLIGQLPASVLARLPVVVVQHMPPIFTAVFAEHLAAIAGCEVREARDGEAVRPGVIHVAPGGLHTGLVRRGADVLLHVHDGPPTNVCRPSVNVLFEAAAAVYGGAALAIVLTGMGRDGLVGARSLAAAGAPIVVQDEVTSIVWGMPGAIAREGLAHAILPLDRIAPAICVFMEGGADD